MNEKQSLNGMPLPLLMERARKETAAQVHNIMTKYQMPAFLYTTILSDVARVINETAVKEKEEAEQYWLHKQAEVDVKNEVTSKKETDAGSAT